MSNQIGDPEDSFEVHSDSFSEIPVKSEFPLGFQPGFAERPFLISNLCKVTNQASIKPALQAYFGVANMNTGFLLTWFMRGQYPSLPCYTDIINEQLKGLWDQLNLSSFPTELVYDPRYWIQMFIKTTRTSSKELLEFFGIYSINKLAYSDWLSLKIDLDKLPILLPVVEWVKKMRDFEPAYTFRRVSNLRAHHQLVFSSKEATYLKKQSRFIVREKVLVTNYDSSSDISKSHNLNDIIEVSNMDDPAYYFSLDEIDFLASLTDS